MSREDKPRLDYKVLHETGKKVYKNSKVLERTDSNLRAMDTERKIEQEEKICFKIDQFIESSELELFFDTSEIQAAILECKGLIENYGELHVELKRELGETYIESYPLVSEKLVPLKDWIKTAKTEMKRIKSESVEQAVNREREISQSNSLGQFLQTEAKEKSLLKAKLKHLECRIVAELKSIKEEDSNFLDDLDKHLFQVQTLIKEHSDLFATIESTFGEEYESDLLWSFEKMSETLHDSKTFLRKKCHRIKENKVAFEREELGKKLDYDDEKKASLRSEKINVFNEIFSNLSDRVILMKSKLNILISNLSDSELLLKNKQLPKIDSEYSEILDWVTELVKSCPSDFNDATGLLDQAKIDKDSIRDSISFYKNSLSEEISNRDLTEEKLKNISNLSISLTKFSGYDSTIDFFTFKAEFDKLIVPQIQAKHLPDYLKNNYLQGQALQLVKAIDDLPKIWERLRLAFGNVDILMSHKFRIIEKLGSLGQTKGDEKQIQMITQIKNTMMDLSSLAEKHEIESKLYHSSNIAKIYNLIGRKRQTDIMKKLFKRDLSDQETWEEIISFLDREAKLKEQILMFSKSHLDDKPLRPDGGAKKKTENSFSSFAVNSVDNVCILCGSNDHVPTLTSKGKKIINYFSCEKFVKLSPKDRLNLLKSKKLCFQCLTPGWKAYHDGPCFAKYKCPHESHKEYKTGIHILLCEHHKGSTENLALLEKYKSRYVTCEGNSHKEFSKNIGISHHAMGSYKANSNNGEDSEYAIYLLQRMKLNGSYFNVFFDSGCGDMCCKKSAADKLGDLAVNTVPGPLIISGVGDNKLVSEHGRYQITLPLHDGTDVKVSGICLNTVTGKFPNYPLTEVESEIHEAYSIAGGFPDTLPKLPKNVGGETDIMIGIQYLKYHPVKIFSLPNGLTLYKSKFLSADGTRGVIGGPHRIFTEIHKNLGNCQVASAVYFQQLTQTYNEGYRLNLDLSLICGKDRNENPFGEVDVPPEMVQLSDFASPYEETSLVESNTSKDLSNDSNMTSLTVNSTFPPSYLSKPPKNITTFDQCESAGTIVDYRCVNCRGCQNCLKSEKVECISVQEEIEQEMINKCVRVNLSKNITTALLPFLCNPDKKLAPNSEIAKAMYFRVIKRFKPKEKVEVIKAMEKLQKLGYTDYIEDLTVEEQNLILSALINHFLAWWVVWNSNSLTSPCRPVFHASLPTSSGYSLNDLLAKGKNNMNQLLIIFLRWRIRLFAYHTDLQTMYNRVFLDPEHWCYQLFYFQDQLDPMIEPKVKVVKTLIYGVRCSGNQAERGLRQTADLQKKEYPRQCEVINHDCYVDDLLSGEHSLRQAYSVTDGLTTVLNRGGFNLKGITFSGFDPPIDLCASDKSINVIGLKWFSKEDILSLKLEDIKFKNNKRPKNQSNPIPDNLTRRDCAGSVGQIFDIIGRFLPIIAGLKLDLSELALRGLDWDDIVPLDLIQNWKSNFEVISKLKEIKFRRAIIPPDAVNLNIELIEMCDASQNLACSATYARFKRKNGLYSCQLLFAKSKVIPRDTSMPRCELFAAVLNASAHHIVKTALKDFIVDQICLTDSQIVLYWISNAQMQLKKWVRNRVVEINRLTNKNDWFYIESKDNTADLGTRKGVTISDLGDGGRWVNGEKWAKCDRSKFPIQSVEQIKLTDDEMQNAHEELQKSEVINNDWIKQQLAKSQFHCYAVQNEVTLNRVKERYIYSRYLVDPNRFRFQKVIRILAIVICFIRNIRRRLNKPECFTSRIFEMPNYLIRPDDTSFVTKGDSKYPFNCSTGLTIQLSEKDLQISLYYFFLKATYEVKHFQNKRAYMNISKEENSILFYNGRILPSQQFNNKINLSDVCEDLMSNTFFVPLIDRFSPLAYAIVNEVHWHHPDVNHTGNETTIRFVKTVAFIMGVRTIVALFRTQCPRCRYLLKKSVKVSMGPISNDNLCIAPAFYVSQVDLFGPFNSYSYVNKRATSKIWFVIFCCSTTGATDIKVMEDYSTNAFVLAFIRFSCKVGYPRKVCPDKGSQLIKGCENMRLKFRDIRHKLHEYGVEYDVCPVGSHYMHGKVERKIKLAKESISKSWLNERLSIIQWETLGNQVANSINNLPICIGNITKDLEHIDLITPNRLLLARNNDRCPVGNLAVTHDVGKIMGKNRALITAWFETWLISCVPKLITQPKWFKSDCNLRIGDIVLFLKSDKEFENIYQYGIIFDVKVSKDSKIRQIDIEYQNPNEKVKRRTTRGSREVVVILPADELGILCELNKLGF